MSPSPAFHRLSRFAAVSFLLLSSCLPASAAPPDAPGSKDSALIQRFAGSWLIGYSGKDFDQTEFPSSTAVKDQTFIDPLTVEGKLTKIFYVSPKGKSPLEVFRNYQQALLGAGFKQKVLCDKACGPLYWAMRKEIAPEKGVTFAKGGLDDVGGGNYSLSGGLIEESNGHLWYGTLPRNGQDVHVLVYTSDAENDSTGLASTFIQILEPKAMQTGQVKVDANTMEKGLQADGKIALYGLYFDTGKADIKPESKPQLEEMAKLLQAQPSLKVYIVGHTDNQGTLEANGALSSSRAQAVAAALVKDFKVDPKRLVARGVSSLAPLASNAAEPGRARNRRVELVQQ